MAMASSTAGTINRKNQPRMKSRSNLVPCSRHGQAMSQHAVPPMAKIVTMIPIWPRGSSPSIRIFTA